MSLFYLILEQMVVIEPSSSSSPKSFFSSYLAVFTQIWPYSLSVLLVFFVTLAMFPSITSEVQSVNKDNKSIFTSKGLWLLFLFAASSFYFCVKVLFLNLFADFCLFFFSASKVAAIAYFKFKLDKSLLQNNSLV